MRYTLHLASTAIATVILACSGCGGTASKPQATRASGTRETRRPKQRAELLAFIKNRDAEARRSHRRIDARQIADEWISKRLAEQHAHATTITIGN